MGEVQHHRPDERASSRSRHVEPSRVFDRNFLEHVQKIGLILTLAAVWITFQAERVVPWASVGSAQPRAVAASEPVSPSSVPASPGVKPISERVLTLPVKGVRPTDLYDSFNESRGPDRRHEAIDIMAEINTPVLAVEDGRIVRLENNRRGGLSIYQFDPSGQFVYYYAHLAGYVDGLAEGDHVFRGQVIARVGQSGNAQTPHLHFAILRVGPGSRWWGGDAINPYPLLAAR